MDDQDKTKEQLLAELAAMRQQVAVLQESEERYRALVDTVPQLMGWNDANRENIRCNRRWYEYTGQTPEEGRGFGWMKALHPDDVPQVMQRINESRAIGEPYEAEYRVRQASDGNYRWHLARSTPIKDKDGKITSWIASATDIDDQKRAEEELAKQRAMLQATIECLPFNFFAIGRDGRYTMQNAVSKAQHRMSAVGKLPEEVCPNEHDLAIWKDNNRRAFAGEKVEGEVTLSLGGEERFYYNVIAPVTDGAEFYGILGFNIDITERKRAEEALQKAHDELEQRVKERTAELAKANEELKREVDERRRAEEALKQSERRFRNYFEQGLIGMAVTSVDKRWLEVNDRLCEIMGYSKEELHQKTWAELTHPDDVEPNLRVFNPLLAGEIEHFTLNKRYLKKDGSIVHTTIHTRAFRKEDGTIDHIVTLIEDITARKQAEEALQQSHDELRAIYDGMFDGLLIVDVESKRYVKANASICRMLGYSEAELLSMSVRDIHPVDELPLALGRIQARAEGRLYGHVETRVLRRDGNILYADVVGSRLTHAGRRCVVSFFRDITERKRVEEALERERQTLWHMLQASDYERQTISYDIHDGLAQYLAAAGMQLQVFDGLRESNPEAARKAYDAATQLVSQSHAEARRLVSEVRPPIIDEIGLETAISHLVHEHRRHGGPNIDCYSDVQFGRLPAILENALYRIVQEALANACKHSKSKKVTVTMTQEGQDVRLEVRDWGIGFDPGSVEKGHFGLEGIRQRARLLGGRLTIESTPGSGTLVQVVVPVVERQGEE